MPVHRSFTLADLMAHPSEGGANACHPGAAMACIQMRELRLVKAPRHFWELADRVSKSVHSDRDIQDYLLMAPEVVIKIRPRAFVSALKKAPNLVYFLEWVWMMLFHDNKALFHERYPEYHRMLYKSRLESARRCRENDLVAHKEDPNYRIHWTEEQVETHAHSGMHVDVHPHVQGMDGDDLIKANLKRAYRMFRILAEQEEWEEE